MNEWLAWLAVLPAAWLAVMATVVSGFRPPPQRPRPSRDALPEGHVLVQLPIYDEGEQVVGLLGAMDALAYPHLRFQLLDDSPEAAALENAARLRVHPRVTHVRRGERSGFKAGAMTHGLTLDDGPFVAVFDADFRPPPDTVDRLMRRFHADDVGAVQGRVVALNRDASALTRAQAASLDLTAASAAAADGHGFVAFWGTGGVWRRATIEAAGGWSGDTITEDRDLSLRAFLEGRRIVFDEDIPVPGLLPETLGALASQQRRWARGEAQTLRKLVGPILAWRRPLSTRVGLVAELFGYSYTLAISLALASVVGTSLLGIHASAPAWIVLASVVAWYAAFAFSARRASAWQGPPASAGDLGVLVLLNLALNWTLSWSVVLGYLGRSATFVRTPKAPMPGVALTWIRLQNLGFATALSAAALRVHHDPASFVPTSALALIAWAGFVFALVSS